MKTLIKYFFSLLYSFDLHNILIILFKFYMKNILNSGKTKIKIQNEIKINLFILILKYLK